MIDGDAAPGDAVGPRAGDRAEPAGDQLGQPAGHLHPRHRRRDGARQRGHPGGPAAAVDPRPAAGRRTAGRPTITQPRIYFGETRRATTSWSRARQAEFDYPREPGDGRGRRDHALDRARPASRSTPRSTRLLFALRFRDLDLLISDQISADSQLLFHRTIAERLGRSRRSCATTRTRTSSSTTRASLVYVQDAYTISDTFPNAPGSTPATLGGGVGPRPATTSTTSGTA